MVLSLWVLACAVATVRTGVAAYVGRRNAEAEHRAHAAQTAALYAEAARRAHAAHQIADRFRVTGDDDLADYLEHGTPPGRRT